MSRPLPTSFAPTTFMSYGPGYVIREGNVAGKDGELDLMRNINFLHGYMSPTKVNTPFNSDFGYVAGASAFYVVRGVWRFSVFRDLVNWNCVVAYENTSAVDDGKVKFELQSDATKNIELTLLANQPQWAITNNRLTYNPTIVGGRDNIVMSLKNGATGTCRIRSVAIYPWLLASIAAGVTTEGFVPGDTLECSADDALSIHLRQSMISNLQVLRQTRSDSILGWCEDPIVRTPNIFAAYKRIPNIYKTMISVPFRAKKGQTQIKFAVAGYRDGASGDILVRTMQDDLILDSATQALGAAWASPYNSQWYDDGGSTLTCIENAWQRLDVQLRGDGAANAYLMGVCAWFADAT